MPSPVPVTRAEAIAKACQAIEDVRLSRAATQHAIEQSRKSLVEMHTFLLRLQTNLFGTQRRRCPPINIAARTVARRSSALKPSPSMKR
jgi:hypothetical protein